MASSPQTGLSADAAARFFEEWGTVKTNVSEIHASLFGPTGLDKRVKSLEATRTKLIYFCLGGTMCVNLFMNSHVGGQVPAWASLGVGAVSVILLGAMGAGKSGS